MCTNKVYFIMDGSFGLFEFECQRLTDQRRNISESDKKHEQNIGQLFE